ncbi:MAG TPA: hypothetical protein VMG11_15690 [Steroidobacteraceae bacterium]|nr:hypothetical protein [Steroidobacteraceae bacterium]
MFGLAGGVVPSGGAPPGVVLGAPPGVVLSGAALLGGVLLVLSGGLDAGADDSCLEQPAASIKATMEINAKLRFINTSL